MVGQKAVQKRYGHLGAEKKRDYISPIKISEIRILGQRMENKYRKKLRMGEKQIIIRAKRT